MLIKTLHCTVVPFFNLQRGTILRQHWFSWHSVSACPLFWWLWQKPSALTPSMQWPHSCCWQIYSSMTMELMLPCTCQNPFEKPLLAFQGKRPFQQVCYVPRSANWCACSKGVGNASFPCLELCSSLKCVLFNKIEYSYKIEYSTLTSRRKRWCDRKVDPSIGWSLQ